jgi:hypothetical protein
MPWDVPPAQARFGHQLQSHWPGKDRLLQKPQEIVLKAPDLQAARVPLERARPRDLGMARGKEGHARDPGAGAGQQRTLAALQIYAAKILRLAEPLQNHPDLKIVSSPDPLQIPHSPLILRFKARRSLNGDAGDLNVIGFAEDMCMPVAL